MSPRERCRGPCRLTPIRSSSTGGVFSPPQLCYRFLSHVDPATLRNRRVHDSHDKERQTGFASCCLPATTSALRNGARNSLFGSIVGDKPHPQLQRLRVIRPSDLVGSDGGSPSPVPLFSKPTSPPKHAYHLALSILTYPKEKKSPE